MKNPDPRVIRSLTVTLPLPPASLHQHAKGHWRAKSQATKKARAEAMWAARALWTGEPLDHARIDYRFFVPDRRRRDAANLVGACKAYVDGIVDAGVIVDDCWERLTIGAVCVEVDRERPRVELAIY